MFKLIRRFIFLTVVLLVVIVVWRNSLGAFFAGGILKKITGFPTVVSHLEIKLTRPVLIMRDITLQNPNSSYKEPRAANISLLEMDYDPASLFGEEIHLQRLALDLSEVVIVRNARGEFNLIQLKHPSGTSHSSGSTKKVRIDEMLLSIGEVLYLDESQDNPQFKTYKIHVKNRSYRNIRGAEDMKRIVVDLLIQSVPDDIMDFMKQWGGKKIGGSISLPGEIQNLFNHIIGK